MQMVTLSSTNEEIVLYLNSLRLVLLYFLLLSLLAYEFPRSSSSLISLSLGSLLDCLPCRLPATVSVIQLILLIKRRVKHPTCFQVNSFQRADPGINEPLPEVI